MTTRPTSIYTWDSGGVNLVTTSAGLQSSGYALNSIPTSGEENYWKKSVSDWLTYFDGASTSGTLCLNPNSGVQATGTPTLTRNAGAVTVSTVMDWIVPVPLAIGKRILAVRVILSDSATGPTKAAFEVIKTTSSTPSIIATSANSAGTGAVQTLSITGLTSVVASTQSYCVFVACQTGTAPMTLYGIEVDYDQP